jgi:hypothetical protein
MPRARSSALAVVIPAARAPRASVEERERGSVAVGGQGARMNPRVKLNVVLVVTFVPAIAGLVFGIQMVVIANANHPLPPYLAPLCGISVLATLVMMNWPTSLRRELAHGQRYRSRRLQFKRRIAPSSTGPDWSQEWYRFMYYSPEVSRCPPSLRRKHARACSGSFSR